MLLCDITLHQIKLPLVKPYRVAFRTYTDFEPILVEMRGSDDRVGWGEAYIPEGASFETADTGWAFCSEYGQKILGKPVSAAKALLDNALPSAPFAATAMLTAIDLLERHPRLRVSEEARIPLLAPIAGRSLSEINEEVERLLTSGYRTLKVKVGWDVEKDLERVGMVQDALAGRGKITLDANRGFNRAQGCRFASALRPDGIVLFEQPCEADEWEANAAVAKVSTVPLMLDESIRTLADIERAASMENVKFVKFKLKRVGGVDRAHVAIERARSLGLSVCLGDGVATELLCWVEACVARGHLRTAGDMNGFLKPRDRILENPLAFEAGSLVLKADYWPRMNRSMIDAHSLRKERIASATAAIAAGEPVSKD